MKALLAVICLLLGGILALQIEVRYARVVSEQKQLENVPETSKAAPKFPVVVQASVFHYGADDQGKVAVEGKIYNSNPFPLINVKMRWQLYRNPDDEKKVEILKQYKYDEICEVGYDYIPPHAILDFATSRIRERTSETVGLTGAYSEAALPRLGKPITTFEVEK